MHAHVKASQTRRCSAMKSVFGAFRVTQGKERVLSVLRVRRGSSGDQGKERTEGTRGKERVPRLPTVLDVPQALCVLPRKSLSGEMVEIDSAAPHRSTGDVYGRF